MNESFPFNTQKNQYYEKTKMDCIAIYVSNFNNGL